MHRLIDYGKEWNYKNCKKQKHLAEKEDEKVELAAIGEEVSETRPRKGFVEVVDKRWDELDKGTHYVMEYELPTEKAKREDLAEGIARDSSEIEYGEKPYSEYRTNDFLPWTDEDEETYQSDEEKEEEYAKEYADYLHSPVNITKSIPWLGRNGVCLSLGKLRVGKSPIQYAGQGVFVTTRIQRGEVVLPSPLIAMREEDFTIYKSDEKQKIARNIIDKSTVVG